MPSRPLGMVQTWQCGSQCPPFRPPPPPLPPTRGTVNATPTPSTTTSTQTLASITSVAAYRLDTHTSSRFGRSRFPVTLGQIWHFQNFFFFLCRKSFYRWFLRYQCSLSDLLIYHFLSVSLSIYPQHVFMYSYLTASLFVCFCCIPDCLFILWLTFYLFLLSANSMCLSSIVTIQNMSSNTSNKVRVAHIGRESYRQDNFRQGLVEKVEHLTATEPDIFPQVLVKTKPELKTEPDRNPSPPHTHSD